MSGTASRSQTRLTYSPALRVAPVLGALGASGDGYSAPPSALPALAGLGSLSIPASVAAPVGPPVMVGSVPFRREEGGGSEGGMAGPAGMATGNASTGSITGDIGALAGTFGPAAGVSFASPTGILGATIGGLVAGGLRAAGAKETANAVMQATFGIDASQGGVKGAANPADIGAPPGGFGPQTGEKPAALGYGVTGSASAGGLAEGVADTSQSPSSPNSGPGSGSGLGGTPGNVDSGIAGVDSSSSNAGGAPGGGPDGQAEGSPGSTDGGSKDGGADFMRGGYTGAGPDGMVQPQKIAGRVHEGEVVIPAAAVQAYGLDPLLMLARGQIEPSRLMALLRG